LNFWRANSLDWRYLYSNFDYGLQIVHKLATIEVRTVGGGVMNQSIGRKLTIDGTAPDTQITGPIDDPDDIQDLDTLIVDKRSGKRATSAKGRRRNRRYENRLLNAQTLDELATDGDVI
jgi:hypothetical protein